MAYRLDPARPTPAEVRRVVSDQLRSSIDLLRAEGGPDADAIHDVRKHLKKARSALRFARGDFGVGVARHANEVLRDCGRALSDQRDADAMVETTERLGEPATAAGESTVAALEALHTVLAERADVSRSGAAQRARVNGVALELDRLDRWLALVPPRAEGWEALAPGVRRQYARGAAALAGLGDAPTDEQLHDWRKRAKDLWYHLRLLRDLWPEVLRPQVKVASHLAELLGDDHDLAVLGQHLPPDEGASDAADDDDAEATETAPTPVDLPAEQVALVRDLIVSERARLQADARRLATLPYADRPDAWTSRLGAWWVTAVAATAEADESDVDSDVDSDEDDARATA